jgi:hypothetical protein
VLRITGTLCQYGFQGHRGDTYLLGVLLSLHSRSPLLTVLSVWMRDSRRMRSMRSKSYGHHLMLTHGDAISTKFRAPHCISWHFVSQKKNLSKGPRRCWSHYLCSEHQRLHVKTSKRAVHEEGVHNTYTCVEETRLGQRPDSLVQESSKKAAAFGPLHFSVVKAYTEPCIPTL